MYMRFNMFICVSDVFISLVWPPKAAAGVFFRLKKAFSDFLNMPILKNAQNVEF